ncbi:MAG: MerR family transcriptional regulator [Candidatus Omnitrophota bacterium]|nr:MerR family transcriptional regulator [Candidatus Omnitrophota bacterium]
MKKKDYYTMKDVVKMAEICKNTIINWEKSGCIKVRRDPLFNYRVWNLEEIQELKKLKKQGRGK